MTNLLLILAFVALVGMAAAQAWVIHGRRPVLASAVMLLCILVAVFSGAAACSGES